MAPRKILVFDTGPAEGVAALGYLEAVAARADVWIPPAVIAELRNQSTGQHLGVAVPPMAKRQGSLQTVHGENALDPAQAEKLRREFPVHQQAVDELAAEQGVDIGRGERQAMALGRALRVMFPDRQVIAVMDDREARTIAHDVHHLELAWTTAIVGAVHQVGANRQSIEADIRDLRGKASLYISAKAEAEFLRRFHMIPYPLLQLEGPDEGLGGPVGGGPKGPGPPGGTPAGPPGSPSSRGGGGAAAANPAITSRFHEGRNEMGIEIQSSIKVPESPGPRVATASPEEQREMEFAKQRWREYQRTAAMSPQSIIWNEYLNHGHWPFQKQHAEDVRLARAPADYLPAALKSAFIIHNLINPERREIVRELHWGASRHTGYGQGVSRIPMVRMSIPPAEWRRLPKSLRDAKRMQLRALDQQMEWRSVAAWLAEVGHETRQDMIASRSLRPNECLGDERWWRAQLDRCYPYEMSTPVGNVIMYTLPPAYPHLDKVQQEILNAVFADGVLRQVAELERPGSTDDPGIRDAIWRQAMMTSRQLTTIDHGGTVNLGETVEVTAFGRVSSYLTDRRARSQFFMVGDSGTGKSVAASGAASAAGVQAIIIEEPKTRELRDTAARLHSAGHRVVFLDLLPDSPGGHELTSIGPATSLFDYLHTQPDIPFVGFDLIEDVGLLLGPGGFEYARTVAKEIFDSFDETLDKPGRTSDVNMHLYRTTMSDGIAACLVASALDSISSPEGVAKKPFWRAFDDYWTTLSGTMPNEAMMERLRALQNEPEGSPFKAPDLEGRGEEAFADVRYRGRAFRALIRDRMRTWEREASLVAPATRGLVDPTTLEAASKGAADFVPQLIKAGGAAGHDYPMFFVGTGQPEVHRLDRWLAEPGTGITVSRLHAANAVACVMIGGETTGAVDFNQQLFRRGVTRQVMKLYELEGTLKDAVVDRGDPLSVLAAFTALGVPGRAAELGLGSQAEARDAGYPRYANTPLWIIRHEAGTLAHTVSHAEAARDLKIAAVSVTMWHGLSKIADAQQFGITPENIGGHTVLAIGNPDFDAGLEWILRRGIGPSRIRPDGNWWRFDRGDEIHPRSYYKVFIADKLTSDYDPDLWVSHPQYAGLVCGARLAGIPAVWDDDKTFPHFGDRILALTGLNEDDGRLVLPVPEYSEARGLAGNAKTLLRRRTLDRDLERPALPMSQIVQLGRLIKLQELDAQSLNQITLQAQGVVAGKLPPAHRLELSSLAGGDDGPSGAGTVRGTNLLDAPDPARMQSLSQMQEAAERLAALQPHDVLEPTGLLDALEMASLDETADASVRADALPGAADVPAASQGPAATGQVDDPETPDAPQVPGASEQREALDAPKPLGGPQPLAASDPLEAPKVLGPPAPEVPESSKPPGAPEAAKASQPTKPPETKDAGSTKAVEEIDDISGIDGL